MTRISQLILVTALALAGWHPTRLGGQDQIAPEWLTGPALRRQLETKVGVTWSSAPLRQKIQNLSRQLRVAIFLDRRIDPSQEPDLVLAEMPLRNCLDSIAARFEAATCFVGPVMYVGPRPVAAKLATVAALRQEEIARLPIEVAARLSRSAAWHWNELATPRELLSQLAQEAGVQLLGLESIPHDLWPATDWPPLSLSDRMTLVLAGFDRTFELEESGKSLRLVPLPPNPKLARDYAVDNVRLLDAIRRAAPDSQVKREGPRVAVTGSAEDHESISRLLAGEKTRTSPPGKSKTTYTMSTRQQPLGAVLKSLQAQADITIVVEPSVQKKLYELVTFDAQNVSLTELVTAILKDTGLRFELEGRDLRILP